VLFMSRKQQLLMDKLIQLAAGDIGLIEEAFVNAAANPGEPPTLDEIVYYIMERRGYKDFVIRAREKDKELAAV